MALIPVRKRDLMDLTYNFDDNYHDGDIMIMMIMMTMIMIMIMMVS